MTTVPPLYSVMNAIQWAVPCMNGHAGRHRVRPACALSAICSGDSMAWPAKSPPPNAPKKMSSWRHMTPFGIPVVPPV